MKKVSYILLLAILTIIPSCVFAEEKVEYGLVDNYEGIDCYNDNLSTKVAHYEDGTEIVVLDEVEINKKYYSKGYAVQNAKKLICYFPNNLLKGDGTYKNDDITDYNKYFENAKNEYVVVNNKYNIYNGPGADYTKMELSINNPVIQVRQNEDEWLLVRTEDMNYGYIHRNAPFELAKKNYYMYNFSHKPIGSTDLTNYKEDSTLEIPYGEKVEFISSYYSKELKDRFLLLEYKNQRMWYSTTRNYFMYGHNNNSYALFLYDKNEYTVYNNLYEKLPSKDSINLTNKIINILGSRIGIAEGQRNNSYYNIVNDYLMVEYDKKIYYVKINSSETNKILDVRKPQMYKVTKDSIKFKNFKLEESSKKLKKDDVFISYYEPIKDDNLNEYIYVEGYGYLDFDATAVALDNNKYGFINITENEGNIIGKNDNMISSLDIDTTTKALYSNPYLYNESYAYEQKLTNPEFEIPEGIKVPTADDNIPKLIMFIAAIIGVAVLSIVITIIVLKVKKSNN